MTNKNISDFITPYCPDIDSFKSESGLGHPGVGLTKELITTSQRGVRSGTEPWRTYFLDMTESDSASITPVIHLSDPENSEFASQGFNGKFIRDALTAYTQAVLYVLTGNAVYRKNAVSILLLWSRLDPSKFRYFTDSHIHVGIPLNRICIAAELIRYSSFEVTDRYSEKELLWSEDEINAFCRNLLIPAVKTFHSDPSGFMNQHNYTVIGAMSAYLFLDDAEGYRKTVEWFTVNKNANNPGFNGSIRRLFRKIYTLDEVGKPEGSGKPLKKPVVQHVEMGRDQAHGCGDLTNAAILSRLLLGQNTKVSPLTGEISTEKDAVGIYEFDEDRILTAAEFFFGYMLGYSSDWTDVPFSIRNGVIADNYTAFAPGYRGRYRTINFWDLYAYYTYNRRDIDLERDYPRFYEGFMKKVPSVYYSAGNRVVNWDNVDGGGDFWLFLPPEAANDEKLIPKKQVHYRSEAEDRGSFVTNPSKLMKAEENGIGYVRFLKSDSITTLAMTDSGTLHSKAAFRIRSDGRAVLKVSGVKSSILIPDTNGEWKYVFCKPEKGEVLGDFYTLSVTDIEGSYLDLDHVDIKPDEKNEDRDAITSVDFVSGENDINVISYENAPIVLDFSAEATSPSPKKYEGDGLPDGAVLDSVNGIFTWTPLKKASFEFFVTVSADETSVQKRAMITVFPSRTEALRFVIDNNEPVPYTKASLLNYEYAKKSAEAALISADDSEFSALLSELCRKKSELMPLSPKLTDDPYTKGESLDYGKMVCVSTMGEEIYNLLDPEDTYCGYYKAVDKEHIMDFGEEYRISARRFGFKARLGFSDRLAGVQIFGSNDKESWVTLTEKEAEYTQRYHEVSVKEEVKNSKFRYLKIRKTTEYPDALRGNIHNLLEFGILRIYGERFEIE